MPDNPDREPDSEEPRDLDFDAEFSRLVADWGPTPGFEDEQKKAEEKPRSDEGLRRLLRQAWPDEDPEPAAPVDHEEHFEPPPPPPLPRPEPRRLAAWIALFGAPILGLILLVSPLPLPSYVRYLLFGAFVGGFGYLVATMGDGRGRDGWDDGARL